MKSHIALVNREFLEIIDYFDHNQLLHSVMINIFFQMRGRESAIAISSYEGYKLIFSPSENENITDVVKRGLLFADLIVLNHSTIENSIPLPIVKTQKWVVFGGLTCKPHYHCFYCRRNTPHAVSGIPKTRGVSLCCKAENIL